MGKIHMASTADFKKEVKNIREGENPIYLSLLRFVAEMLPDSLTPGKVVEIYGDALNLICQVENTKETNMNFVHKKALLFIEETFPQVFADRVTVLLVNKYLE